MCWSYVLRMRSILQFYAGLVGLSPFSLRFLLLRLMPERSVPDWDISHHPHRKFLNQLY